MDQEDRIELAAERIRGALDLAAEELISCIGDWLDPWTASPHINKIYKMLEQVALEVAVREVEQDD